MKFEIINLLGRALSRPILDRVRSGKKKSKNDGPPVVGPCRGIKTPSQESGNGGDAKSMLNSELGKLTAETFKTVHKTPGRTQAPQDTDAEITRRLAEAIKRGIDLKEWLVLIVQRIGWRHACYLLSGLISGVVLVYLRIIPLDSKPLKPSNAQLAIERYHIDAIESRDDTNASPPLAFIASARSTVLITGFSAFRTIENASDTIKQLLENGVEVYMLVLDPRSEDVKIEESLAPGQSVAERQRAGLKNAVERYSKLPNFHLRCMSRMPGFTGILVDAEVEPRTNRPRSIGGKLRYQIRGYRIPQRRGFVVQLRQSDAENNPMFALFWEDMRTQWNSASDALPILRHAGIIP